MVRCDNAAVEAEIRLMWPGVEISGSNESRQIGSFGAYGESFGTIPPVICNHTSLWRFAMFGQSLSGTVPPCLLEMNVDTIYLRSNLLSGTLPTGIDPSPSGAIRDFSYNLISGFVPNGAILSSNRISGFIPEDFDGQLRNNEISGTIPASLECTNYHYLLENRLSGFIPEGTGCTEGDMTGNALSGTIPASMVEMVLSRNRLSGFLPDASPDSVAVAHNRLSGYLPDLSSAYEADVSTNLFSGYMPESLPLATEWLCNDNLLSGTVPDAVMSVETIDISGNMLSGTMGTALSTDVLHFVISNNLLSGTMPGIPYLSTLETFDISNNNFQGPIEGGCGGIEPDLGNMAVCNAGDYGLACAPSLKIAKLSSNNFSSFPDLTSERDCRSSGVPVPSDCLQSLYLLDVHGNPLEDFSLSSLAVSVGYLNTLLFLDASSTQMGGDLGLPSTGGRACLYFSECPDVLSGLSTLNLEDNALTGNIGATPALLTELDISGNSGLVGALPEVFAGIARVDATDTSLSAPALPSYVTVDGIFVEQPGQHYECQGVTGGALLSITYDNYQRCVCLAGSYGSPPDCALCPTGSVSTRDMPACTACPNGTVAGIGQASCVSCLPGTSPAADGGTCEPCEPGHVAGFEAGSCEACQPAFIPSADSSFCTPCAGGSESGTGASTCTLCPGGTFSPGGVLCAACPAGHISSATREACTACPIGRYATGGVCETCPAGSIAASPGSPECSNCSMGQVPNEDQSTCVECPEGSIAPSTGMSACVPCGVGLSSWQGGHVCTPCPAGQTASVGSSCEACPPQFYSSGGVACQSCPEGASCVNGVASARAGYFMFSEAVYLQCQSEAACPGGATSLPCGEGHVPTAPLCSACEKNYAMQDGSCVKCLSDTVNWLVLVSILIFFIAYLVVSILGAFGEPSNAKVLLKLILNHVQQVSLVVQTSTFAGTYFQSMLGVTGSSSPSLNSSFVACLFRPKFETVLLVSLLIPMLVGALCLAVAAITRAAVGGTHRGDMVVDVCVIVTVQFLFLMYPSLCKVILEAFDCYGYAEFNHLVVDASYDCSMQSNYSYVFVLALVGICVYVAGIPAAFFGLLYCNRADLHAQTARRRYQFLFFGYTDAVYFYEVLILFRKSCLATVIVFVSSPGTQVAMLGMIFVLMQGLQYRLQPFRIPAINVLEFFSFLLNTLCVLCSTMFIQLQESDEWFAVAVTVLLSVLQIVYILALVLVFLANEPKLAALIPRPLQRLTLHAPCTEVEGLCESRNGLAAIDVTGDGQLFGTIVVQATPTTDSEEEYYSRSAEA